MLVVTLHFEGTGLAVFLIAASYLVVRSHNFLVMLGEAALVDNRIITSGGGVQWHVEHG